MILFFPSEINVVEPTKMVVVPSVTPTISSQPVVIPTPSVGDNSLLVTISGYDTETVMFYVWLGIYS